MRQEIVKSFNALLHTKPVCILRAYANKFVSSIMRMSSIKGIDTDKLNAMIGLDGLCKLNSESEVVADYASNDLTRHRAFVINVDVIEYKRIEYSERFKEPIYFITEKGKNFKRWSFW